jgi:type I restriction enzyme M protein
MPKISYKDKPQKNGNGGLAALIKELWNAAVELRGNIEPSDYKRYVLPLIFLRFLSLRYEKRRSEIDVLIADPQSDFFTTDPKLADTLREDPDLYTASNVFLVPEEARWDSIIKIARADDIKLQLDNILALLEKTFPKLKGLLPPIYAGSNLDRENIAGLINLFSKDVFKSGGGGIDMLGRVYEYFIGEFASSEGKRGGEYFTPASIVNLLVAMLEPTEGKVFDPCCGSGGMFVQSDHFAKHSGKLSFFGQESKDFTYRLCRLNLFIHGLDGDIRLGSSYDNDQHSDLKADFVLANPPFNDGSKGEKGWGAQLIDPKDARLLVGDRRLSLAAKNANYMWMMHFLYHLGDGGTAGFVMANGAMNTNTGEERAAREALVEGCFVDCIVQMPEKLFANTPIPSTLWFLSKNRRGNSIYRPRHNEILFIDARKKATLIEGSRKQKELSIAEINEIANVYHHFRRRTGSPENIEGFCKTATVDEVRTAGYTLTPGRYVGTGEVEDDGEPFDQKMQRLTQELSMNLAETERLAKTLRVQLRAAGFPLLDQNT